VADIKLFGDDDRVKGQDQPQPIDAVVADERTAEAPTADRGQNESRRGR
jgi:hypothetical protein